MTPSANYVGMLTVLDRLVFLADSSAMHVVRSGVDECFVTNVYGSRDDLVFGPLTVMKEVDTYRLAV
jgi:hypothetical protein